MQSCRHRARPLPQEEAAVGRKPAAAPSQKWTAARTRTHSPRKQPTQATGRGVGTQGGARRPAQSLLSPPAGRRAAPVEAELACLPSSELEIEKFFGTMLHLVENHFHKMPIDIVGLYCP